jgi:putative hemolysin
VENLLSLPGLNAVYEDVRSRDPVRSFADRALDSLMIDYQVMSTDAQVIPSSGPLVVVANHPFGGIEGLILPSLLQRVRSDVKVMANLLLGRMPELRSSQIHVDPFGGPEAAERNLRGLREAVEWVRGGGVLGVFPAGEVSHFSWQDRGVVDPPWSTTIARIVRRTQASVLPVHFDGRNSSLFQTLGMVHPRLRTAMLPRELLKKRRHRITVRLGQPIPHEKLKAFESPEEMTEYLRLRTYLLRSRGLQAPSSGDKRRDTGACHPVPAVVEAESDAILEAEIHTLPDDQLLLNSGDFEVWFARAPQIPHVLREIGRLREVTFRQVGEGTGRCIDLDRFDERYVHLFVWDRAQRMLVGAYRLGLTDELRGRRATDELYTSTLFRVRPQLLDQLGPAIELGRSFVRSDYQKNYSSLLLLWRGIGHFIVRYPRYRRLFGAVSISNSYHCVTRDILMTFLESCGRASELRALIKPKNPPRRLRSMHHEQWLIARVVRDIRDVDELVRDIEADHKSIPVLLRQYLKLNARLLGFNVDPDFGGVLDGLMLVDLTEVDPAILTRHMGRAGMQRFMAYHALAEQGSCSHTLPGD